MAPGNIGGGRRSRPLRARSALSSLLLVATSLSACDGAGTSDDAQPSMAAAGGSAGAAGGGLILLPPTPPCHIPDTDTPVFAASVVTNDAPARRELFTWTTVEQAQELRAGSVLLTRSEREGLGPGYAIEVLAKLASSGSSDMAPTDVMSLAALLSGPKFEKARFAWPAPWATRMGWPGETYGDQLVRIVLRQEAWLARYRNGTLDVVDMNNEPVALADALAHPERVAGVFFVNDGSAGGPECGTFSGGSNGYREFIIGNESMIEQWSLGTAEIRARLEADLALLGDFFPRLRTCPVTEDAQSWNRYVLCGWSYSLGPLTELDAYQGSLAMPSPGYLPAAMPLATLIETLQASLFEPDPFIMPPKSP